MPESKTMSQNQVVDREHLPLVMCLPTVSSKCSTNLNVLVGTDDFPLIYCSLPPPPPPSSLWLKTFFCPRRTTRHIMDVVIASIFLQEGGGGELLQEDPASFLQGVPVRAHCPLVNTQNQELPGSRVKASLDIKHNQRSEHKFS